MSQNTLELERRWFALEGLIGVLGPGGHVRIGLELAEQELEAVGRLLTPVKPGSPEERAVLLAGKVLQGLGPPQWLLNDLVTLLEILAANYEERLLQIELPLPGAEITADPFDPTGYGRGTSWD